MSIDANATSSYLQILPAIFSEDPFLGRFLMAFEQVLTGLPGLPGREPEPPKGLEEIIATISMLFDPKETREEFLPWLAEWVAVALRADWDAGQQRTFLANIVPLYRRRGTKENLAELLRINIGLKPEIDDRGAAPLQIKVHSTIGKDTYINGSLRPHFFTVTVVMPSPDPVEVERKTQIARALIDLQKPAHTNYQLFTLSLTMQIGKRSTVGKNTLLGTITEP